MSTTIHDRLMGEAKTKARTSGRSPQQEYATLLDDATNRRLLGAERAVARLMPRDGSSLDDDALAVCRGIVAHELAEVRRYAPHLPAPVALRRAVAAAPADVRRIFDDGPAAA